MVKKRKKWLKNVKNGKKRQKKTKISSLTTEKELIMGFFNLRTILNLSFKAFRIYTLD